MQDNPTQHRADLARTIGYDLLGPVVHRWLLGLEQHIAFFEEEDAALLVFMVYATFLIIEKKHQKTLIQFYRKTIKFIKLVY